MGRSSSAPLLAILVMLSASSATGVMQLMPPSQEIEAQRGAKGTFAITVTNIGDEDVPSRFTVHDLDISADGVPFVPEEPWARGCGQWIQLEPKDSIIKPHESITLQGTLAIPRTAEGGYYALVRGNFTTTTIPLSGERGKLKGSKIGLESQAVVAILLTVPSSRNKPKLVPDTLYIYPHGDTKLSGVKAGISFGRGAKTGWKVVMPIRNEGNIHARVSGQMTIWSEGGAQVGSAPFEVGRGYVLPGKTRNLTATGDRTLPDGYYMLRVVLQQSERSTMTNSFAFAIYKGEVYPGAISDKLAGLLKASSPGFSLNDPFLRRNITPGGVSYVSVQLRNTTRETLVLLPRKLEWSLNDAGLPVLGSGASIQSRSCSLWLSFAEQTVTLPPGGGKSFSVKVDPPRDASGEYYSAITFDREGGRTDLPSQFLAGRTQLIALATPRDLNCQVEVDSLRTKRETSKELTLTRFTFKVKNRGNVHCFVSGSMSLEKEAVAGIYKSVGQAAGFGSRDAYLLPGGSRAFEIDIPNLEKGQYRAILSVTYKEETQPVVKYQKIRLM